MAIEWGSNALRLAPISGSDDTRSKLTPDTYFKTHYDLVCTCSKISPRRDSGSRRSLSIGCTQEAPQLRTRITHDNLTILTFDLSCMGPKSSPIPSDEYHSQDLVHGIGEKPSSTDCDGPCRAHTPKERSNEVAGKVISSRVHHVALAAAVSD